MQSNEELLESLREDELEAEMQEIAMADAALLRMTQPVPAEKVVLMDVCSHSFAACLVAAMTAQVLLAPRFGIVQGVKADGSRKVRTIDHFSWSCSAGMLAVRPV